MQFNTNQFTYKNMCFVAEASDLRLTSTPREITLYSAKTRMSVNYYLSKTDTDRSGEDIAGWRYRPTESALVLCPKAKGTSVLIIND
jgi:hypothetical protein